MKNINIDEIIRIIADCEEYIAEGQTPWNEERAKIAAYNEMAEELRDAIKCRI